MISDQEPIQSPRLHDLHKALIAGDKEALNFFWQEVVEKGAPLVESIEDDEDHSLVTFLWQSDVISHVSIISLLTNPTTCPMTRLPETDLWYMTCRARNDVRVTYQFSPIDPTLQTDDDASPWANWRPDPLNPKTFAFYDDEEDPTGVRLTRSILELPEASSQPWIQPRDDVSSGQVQLHTIQSDILSNERRVWIYTPPIYTPNADKAPTLLILFDGWGYLKLIPTPTILDNLLSDGRIPPTVAVMVDSLSVETRMRELVYHKPFNDFLVRELMPWIHNHFHVSSDPGQTVIGGSSAGGLAAAYAGLEHSQVFGNILSQSGAFRLLLGGEEEFGWLARQFAQKEKLPLKFHLDAGLLEENSLRDLGDGPNLLQSNRQMRDVLRGKGYPVHYTEFSGGHDYVCWQGVLSDALQALLGQPPN